jgi:hypothetical protein
MTDIGSFNNEYMIRAVDLVTNEKLTVPDNP